MKKVSNNVQSMSASNRNMKKTSEKKGLIAQITCLSWKELKRKQVCFVAY